MMPRLLVVLGCIAVVLAASCTTKFDTGACEEGLTSCAGECVDLASDEANCGECGNACAGGESCSSGTCGAGCEPGLEDCGGSCVDLATNGDHCGACGNACADGGYCQEGACICPDGERDCGGACVNTSSDHANCGGCGIECSPDEVCSSGTCTSECEPGLENCGGSCVDLATNGDHCGACGNACAVRRHCVDSACVCDEGLEDCSGACVDLETDPLNCGSCGAACGLGMDCASSICVCSAGTTACSSGGCAPDDDGDGVCNTEDACPGLDDSTPLVFRNPGFTTTGDWTLAGGAVIDPTATGGGGPGEAAFDSSAMCTDPSVTQEVCVPGDWSTLGPLKLKFMAREGFCSFEPCFGDLGAVFGVYGRMAGFVSFAYDATLLCFGEAAYAGGTVSMGLFGVWPPGSSCSPSQMRPYYMDDFSIVTTTTSECPAPGTILNGDFSLGMTGWTYGGSGIARVDPDTGGDLSGHYIAHAGVCESPRLEGLISIPLFTTVPNAALQFQMSGTSGHDLGVEIHDGMERSAMDFTAGGSWRTYRMCLSPANQGNVITLFTEVRFNYTCAANVFREFWIDDFTIVSDSSTCP